MSAKMSDVRALLPALSEAVEELRSAVERVRELHSTPHWCRDDEARSDCYHPDAPGMPWPCPTLKALGGAS